MLKSKFKMQGPARKLLVLCGRKPYVAANWREHGGDKAGLFRSRRTGKGELPFISLIGSEGLRPCELQ